MTYSDHSGRRLGMLTVISRVGTRCGVPYWLCRCDCGREKEVASSNFRCIKSCGCAWVRSRSDAHALKLHGMLFGKWTVIGPAEDYDSSRNSGGRKWICRCECGKIAIISGSRLNKGKTKSCVKCSRRRSPRKAHHKLIQRYRTRTSMAFSRQSAGKTKKTIELLGCDAEFLASHLASLFLDGMSIENYGEWHIDHIRPICSFDLNDPDQVAQCFHYTNLQPLWKWDNLSKGGKYPPLSGENPDTP